MIFALVAVYRRGSTSVEKPKAIYLCAVPEQIIMFGAATDGLVNATGAGLSEAAANKNRYQAR